MEQLWCHKNGHKNYEETQLILINFHFHFFKAKLGLDSGLKVCAGGGMPNIIAFSLHSRLNAIKC